MYMHTNKKIHSDATKSCGGENVRKFASLTGCSSMEPWPSVLRTTGALWYVLMYFLLMRFPQPFQMLKPFGSLMMPTDASTAAKREIFKKMLKPGCSKKPVFSNKFYLLGKKFINQSFY